jgi:hypothetical protein
VRDGGVGGVNTGSQYPTWGLWAVAVVEKGCPFRSWLYISPLKKFFTSPQKEAGKGGGVMENIKKILLTSWVGFVVVMVVAIALS